MNHENNTENKKDDIYLKSEKKMDKEWDNMDFHILNVMKRIQY